MIINQKNMEIVFPYINLIYYKLNLNLIKLYLVYLFIFYKYLLEKYDYIQFINFLSYILYYYNPFYLYIFFFILDFLNRIHIYNILIGHFL